jgi:transposase
VGQNFRPVERDQQYLMPPSLRDWLPADDLAWVVIDAVDQLDLAGLRARYRLDGRGAAAYDPALMVALLLYAYATGERSSRRIEAHCRRDIGYRVICANAVPDHATIARFRAEHEAALKALFGELLRLCATAGLGRLGLVALDGTKIAAAASMDANRKADALDAEIARMLAEATAVDAAEDATVGPQRRGDELPPGLRRRDERLARLQEARRQLDEARAVWDGRLQGRRPRGADGSAGGAAPGTGAPDATDTTTSPVPGETERATEPIAEATASPPSPPRRRPCRPGWSERNTTDPDCRKMRGGREGWLVGYNAQAAVAEDGLILAHGLTQSAVDYDQLAPMLAATLANVAAAGFAAQVGTLLADAGYASEANLLLEPPSGPRLLIPPTSARPPRPGSPVPRSPARESMRERLAEPAERARYKRRGVIVEPVFGQAKEVRGFRRFMRRGRDACAAEWALDCTAHNLLKLWRHRLRMASATMTAGMGVAASRAV